MTRPLDQLLQREMDRKEFLLTLGFGLASLFGFSTIIHLLSGKGSTRDHYTIRTSGYGSSDYGDKAPLKKVS